MNDEDDGPAPTWIAKARDKAPYAIGLCGLLGWFALLYFMLHDVS